MGRIRWGSSAPEAEGVTAIPSRCTMGWTYCSSGMTYPSSAITRSTASKPSMRLASSGSPQSAPIISTMSSPSRTECGEGPNIAKPVEVEGSPTALPQL